MNTINFSTPIRYQSPKTCLQHIHEGVEDYFYLYGKSAYVVSKDTVDNYREVVITNEQHNRIKQVVIGIFKIISYATIAIPLIMLVAKVSFRSLYKFRIVSGQISGGKLILVNLNNSNSILFSLPAEGPLPAEDPLPAEFITRTSQQLSEDLENSFEYCNFFGRAWGSSEECYRGF